MNAMISINCSSLDCHGILKINIHKSHLNSIAKLLHLFLFESKLTLANSKMDEPNKTSNRRLTELKAVSHS